MLRPLGTVVCNTVEVRGTISTAIAVLAMEVVFFSRPDMFAALGATDAASAFGWLTHSIAVSAHRLRRHGWSGVRIRYPWPLGEREAG